MQEGIVKVCPNCGSEFQIWVERCLDCGTSLVTAVPGSEPRQAAPAAPEEPAIPPGCVHLRTAAVGWIRQLSEDLDEAGIRHWITPPQWRRDPSLFILPADEEAARRIDRARYAVEVPGVEAEEALPQPFRLRQRDPADDLDVKVCPRCGDEYLLRVETCVDCGVALVRPWNLERARKEGSVRTAIVPSAPSGDPGACPACGDRLRGDEPECPGCGLILAQPDVCPHCGVELEPHVPNCRRCGAEIFGISESY